jgi:hypothetical protein
MIISRILRWAIHLQNSKRHLPQSDMGRALSYLQNQWPFLIRYMEDGRVEPERSGDSRRQIDNNLGEHAMRPAAVGQKNWLLIGSETAGETSAILYTVVERARRGKDAFAYLRDALTRLPRMKAAEVIELLPENWQPASKPAA